MRSTKTDSRYVKFPHDEKLNTNHNSGGMVAENATFRECSGWICGNPEKKTGISGNQKQVNGKMVKYVSLFDFTISPFYNFAILPFVLFQPFHKEFQ
jgi:hypothetical protein